MRVTVSRVTLRGRDLAICMAPHGASSGRGAKARCPSLRRLSIYAFFFACAFACARVRVAFATFLIVRTWIVLWVEKGSRADFFFIIGCSDGGYGHLLLLVMALVLSVDRHQKITVSLQLSVIR